MVRSYDDHDEDFAEEFHEIGIYYPPKCNMYGITEKENSMKQENGEDFKMNYFFTVSNKREGYCVVSNDSKDHIAVLYKFRHNSKGNFQVEEVQEEEMEFINDKIDTVEWDLDDKYFSDKGNEIVYRNLDDSDEEVGWAEDEFDTPRGFH